MLIDSVEDGNCIFFGRLGELVYSRSLENSRAFIGPVSSNLTPSAKNIPVQQGFINKLSIGRG